MTALREAGANWTRPKLSRIENREQAVKPREAEVLLDIYAVTDPEVRNRLIGLASAPRDRGWIADIRRSLPPQFHRYVDWESVVVACRHFQTLVIPGLLQTPEYARGLISGITPELSEDEVERRVAARMVRQQILTRARPPQLHVILDEGVLERPIDSPRTMHKQIRRLIEAAESPSTTVQILPKSVGASPALEGPFSILTLPDPIPDMGYTEAPTGAAYLEDRDAVRDLTLRWGSLTDRAMTPDLSAAFIESAGQRLIQ
ncbi:DUF5753 domain-containing protein [Pseudonocardia sp. HH130630-07]|uniref:DUF5753 domain-containing protein n=1 Tax=Pseudonocardia sp. HH130630-07 TaxID=1690815 RepID=UPI001E44AAD5|nr:DUF5753 domain-containing protein [Pseudonocardia sp. HH130630-07]